MLDRNSRRRRRGETGQVLILALAFIAFFGLLISSVLSFGGVTALQHTHTEATATKDGLAEGGAAFAAADAVLSGLPCPPPGTQTKGQLTMQSGDVATYTVEGCYPFNTQSLAGPGHCVLCVLNQTPLRPGTAALPGTSVLTADKGISTTGGDDYINGSITGSAQLRANPISSAHVRVWSGANTSGCCAPPQVWTYPNQFKDPLPNLAPSPAAVAPTVCSSSEPTEGCSASFPPGAGSGNTITPGLWDSLTITGQADVTAAPGVYVFTNRLQIKGNGRLTGTGVTIYLACPGYPSPCAKPETGGSISVSDQGNLTLSGPGSPQYQNVDGADMAIVADPNLLDPGGVASCSGVNGPPNTQNSPDCVLNLAGNGATITGSIDTRGGGVSIAGDGGLAMPDGLLLTNSLFVSGDDTIGLTLSGPGTFSGPSGCGVFDDSVSGTGLGKGGSATSSGQGRAVIQAGCGKAGANGVVDLNYTP